MAIEERCPTKLLDDTPADTDDFGGHESVARSIAELVRTEAGGKAIGLEGGWGAGKSTIVNLTSTILAQTKNGEYRTVVFDTWAHQGDPLRRTFLETLIKRAQAFNWVNSKKWEGRLAELAKRRTEDRTTVIPRLTGAGIWFALTLLVIPLGSALVAAGASLLASQSAVGKWALLFLLIGLVGALLPLICYFIVAVYRRLRRFLSSGGKWENGGMDEFPALVAGQATTESLTVATHTPDPTSVEFESEFRRLLKEALEPDGRRLLLVIDNLDRVEPSDALSIWSTLQTFLGHSDYHRTDWLDRLWVLIPYDSKSVLRLWDKPVSDSESTSGSTLATSFLDKTFQLRFRAPPLLLLDWREFLQETLQKALPRHDEADFRDVYRAYAAKGGFEATAPTPRDLKIFVNQIGSLHRIRQDEFPLSYLACYVLLQGDCRNVLGDLLAETNLEIPRRIIGSQCREIMAALHFGVPVEEARQILLRAPIESAMTDGDAAALSRLALAHPAGFWSVLEDCVPAGAEDWNSLSPAELATAAIALANSHVLNKDDSRPEAATVRSRIGTAASAVQAWAPFESAISHGIVAIASLAPNPEEIIPQLIEAVANAPVDSQGRPSDEEKQGVSPRVWMSSGIILIKGLIDLGFSEQIGDGIRVPLDAEQWVDAADEIADKDPRGQFLKYFELHSISDIEQRLAQRVTSGQFDETIFHAARAALATRSSNGMKNVGMAVLSRLQSNWNFQADQLVFMLKILRFSRSVGLIDNDQYAEFAGTGQYLHLLYLSASDSQPEAVAECMFGYLEAVPDASERHYGGQSRYGYNTLTNLLQNPNTLPDVVKHFTAIAEETENLPIVFEMATEQRPVPPFLARVLKTLLTSEDVSKPHDLVRANWSVIRDVFETGEDDSQTFGTFLKALPELAHLVAGVLDGTFDVCDCGLYVGLLASGADPNLVNWCANGLPSVSREAWSTEFASQGDLVDLVTALRTRGASVVLGADYLDALVDCARNVVDGGEMLMALDAWPDVLSFLDTYGRELFSRRAYKILEGSHGGASVEFFDLFGDMLSNRELLANEQWFIDQVCRPILDTGNARGMTWVADIADSDPALLIKHRDHAAINDFKDRIRQRLNDTSDRDPTFHDLARIGAALGISRPQRESS